MKQNQLGKSDIYVSALTLGCMSLGIEQSKAAEIIDQALNAGINHLDTADLYNFGKNEEIIGAAIKNKRAEIILTTKVGNHFNQETKKTFWDPSKKYIINGLKESLRRLQTDYIDFYMLHGGTIDDPIDETIAAFDALKQEGLIRAYGISSIRPNVIREYVEKSSIDAVMMQYNLFDRRPEEAILDLLHENKISVIARGPLAKGMLSNQAAKQIAKKGANGYLDYSFAELEEIELKLTKIDTSNHTINATALKYVLQHPSVATAVFGASSVDQLKENIDVDLSTPLDDDVYEQLEDMTKPIQYADHR